MSAEWAACERLRGRYHRQWGTGRLRHNHTTRDIQPEGDCPACDAYHHRKETTMTARALGVTEEAETDA